MPRRAGSDITAPRQLMQLRRELQAAVESEKYEEAARLRDLIKNKEASGET